MSMAYKKAHTIGIIVQARMSSKRLPGKVLLPIQNKPILLHVVDRLKRVKNKDIIVVATSLDESDDIIQRMCEQKQICCYRDSLDNVLERYINCADFYSLKTIVRITADCPFISYALVDHAIELYEQNKYDLVYVEPDGLDCEVFSVDLLKKYKDKITKYSVEHFTMYFYSEEARKDGIKICRIPNPLKSLKLSVDTCDDYLFLKKLAEVINIDFQVCSCSNRSICIQRDE